jgi:hypothetical protein
VKDELQCRFTDVILCSALCNLNVERRLQHTFLYVLNWPHVECLVIFLHTTFTLLTISSTPLCLLCFLVGNLIPDNVHDSVVIGIVYSVQTLIFSRIGC